MGIVYVMLQMLWAKRIIMQFKKSKKGAGWNKKYWKRILLLDSTNIDLTKFDRKPPEKK